ncbi:MAG: bifunctional folylpolyglutamate synthase/dihydrofolate synthase [Desulfobacteraceae bacterium]|nr:bifunctional folylpolyglutamate synthase/dihydrofolate synthase [Desulfobacteraceae bacterium]
MQAKIDYQACLDEMFGLARFGIVLGLDTIRKILSEIGNPQEGYSCIHIAGTNGKGSIASSLSTILLMAGYKVGLYTSPHLVRFNERICINNIPISDEEVVESYLEVKNADTGPRKATFFEITTAMALLKFKKSKVDWAIIETGMGGKLDATNVLFPKVSIISNISLEHQDYLGKTIAKISGEKAGIIKPKVPVVTGVKQKSAVAILEKVAKENHAPLYRLGEAFHIRRNRNQTFNYNGLDQKAEHLKTSLAGKHQADNAALVLAACEVLSREGVRIPFETIRNGIENNQWPGRLEVVSRNPLVILDGAHNLAAAKLLGRYLSELPGHPDLTLVIGILDDKPYEAMLRELLPVCKKVILTSPKIDRALPVEKLFAVAEKLHGKIEMIKDVEEAVFHAMDQATAGEAVCIAGSLYVVGEAKQALGKRGIPAFKLKT